MAKDVRDIGDTIGSALGTIAHEVVDNFSSNGHARQNGDSPLAGARGVAAGAALAAAVPLAGKAVRKLAGAKGAVEEKVGEATEKANEATDVRGLAKNAAKKAGKKMLPDIPGLGGEGGDEDSDENEAQGVGKGRRMPVQQAVDIGVPLQAAYDQWTQFEDWTQFMHRLDRVTQEDDCTVSFRAKVWGMSKEFVAQIEEQRPGERIRWSVTEGVSHTGVVTFHELTPSLTRVQVTLDLEPGSLIEKAARGMRHVKRAVRADLARFKAFIEMREEPTGAWRGTIHEGEIVKEKSGGQKSAGSSSSRSGSKSSSGQSRSKASSSSKSGGRSRAKKSGSSSGSRKRKRGSQSKKRSSARS